MKIKQFEELDSWKKARELANTIYDLTEQKGFSRDFRLRDQIRDSSGSVMHNIAEGFDAGSDAEFIRFLKISRRSPVKYNHSFIWLLTGNTLQQLNFKLLTTKQLGLND